MTRGAGCVLDEANAIETTYLRAGYLPEPASTESPQNCCREYAPLRIVLTADASLDAEPSRARWRSSSELWAIAEDVARTTDQGDLVSLYLDSLNEVINLHEARVTGPLRAGSPRRSCCCSSAGLP